MRGFSYCVLAFFLLNAIFLLAKLPEWHALPTGQSSANEGGAASLRIIKASPLVSPEHYLLSFLSAARAVFDRNNSAPWRSLKQLQDLENEFAASVLTAHAMHVLSPSDLEHAVASYVQLRLHAFQQIPVNACDSTPRLRCSLSKGCGFACVVHHLADCLIVAQETGRTLVLHEAGWMYDNKPDDPEPHAVNGGWRYFFRPLGACPNPVNAPRQEYSDKHRGDLSPTVLSLPIIDMRANAHWAVYYTPAALKPLIDLFHNRSALWYLSQIEKYILRPNSDAIAFMQRVQAHVHFRHPSVGVHIRRTDKLDSEAKFHPTEKYYKAAMKLMQATPWLSRRAPSRLHTERRRIDREVGFDWDWFASQPTDELAVYAAADEVASCVELRQHFPSSQVMCNDVGVEMAGLDTRMSRLSLLYLLADIFHLAESDFFVATFSSHVARLVYELMQDCTRLESPASARATSLDDKWYYSG